METEDLLKYLLILLFVLPGLFTKKKKKDDNRRRPQQYEEQHYEYEDPFKDFKTFEDENVSSEDTFEQTQRYARTQTEFQDYNSIPSTPSEEGVSVFSQSQIEAALASIAKYEFENNEIAQSGIQNAENHTEINGDNEFLNDFDAQKAVIYSEILSPKYSR